MNREKIEVVSAGCSTCKETIELVKKVAGTSHELVIHDMQKPQVASKAKQQGVKSVLAVVIDGKLARCCAGRGPDEHVLRSAFAQDSETKYIVTTSRFCIQPGNSNRGNAVSCRTESDAIPSNYP